MASNPWDIFAADPPPYTGEWERMSPLLSRRRRPDGTWEVKLTPAFAGGKPAIGKVEGGTPVRSPARRRIDASAAAGSLPFAALSGALDVLQTAPEALQVAGATAAESMIGTARLPSVAGQGIEAAIQAARRKPPTEEDLALATARRALDAGLKPESPLAEMMLRRATDPRGSAVPDPLAPVQEMTTGWREEATQQLAETAQDLPTPVAAAIFEGATGAGLAADASQYVGGRLARPFGVGAEALSDAGIAARLAGEAAEQERFLGPARAFRPSEAGAVRVPGGGGRRFSSWSDDQLRQAIADAELRSDAAASAGDSTRHYGQQIKSYRSELERRAKAAPAGERRADLGMRAAVDRAIEQVKGLSDDELQSLLASPNLDKPTELAIERVAFLRGQGYYGPIPGTALPDINPSAQTALPGMEAPLRPGELPTMARGRGRKWKGPGPYPPGGEGPMSTKGVTNITGMQDELAKLAAENEPLLQRERAGRQPVSQYHDAQALANNLGMTMEDFLATPAGNVLGSREVALGRSLLGGLQGRFKELADQLAAGAIPEAGTQAAKQELAKVRLDMTRLMAVIQGRGSSEWGRGMRSLQDTLDPLRLATTPDDKAQLALLKRYADQLDDETIRLVSQIDASRPEDLVSFLRKMESPRFRDYRMTYFINSILSGTKTMVRNLNGNVVRLTEQTVMRPAGAAIEQFIVAPLQHRPPERLLRETLPATMGVFRGIPEGIKKFAYVLKNGYDPERLIANLTGEASGKFSATAHLPLDPFKLSENRLVRAVGVPLTLPGRLLEATDAMFKIMATTSESYAWATRKAIQEKATDIPTRVAELIAQQPDEMVEAARHFAQKATYTDPMSWVGSLASGLRRGPKGSVGLATKLEAKGGLGNKALASLVRGPETVGQHLMPFIHIADRVSAALTDYIPLSKPFKVGRLLAEKSPEASDLIARQVVGGALGMLGITWANQGKLIGEAPRDDAQRNDFYAAGKQPYSLLVAGRWVPIRDVLGPWAGPFVAAAMYHDHVQVGEDPTTATVGMTLGSARYILDASYLDTLQSVIQSVEEESQGDIGRGIVQAGARVVGGYAPFSGFQRNLATAMDPRVVEREGFIDELKSGLPGLREDLPSRIGPLGEELTQATGAAGGFLPVVPTENKVVEPQLEEHVARLRYTLERKRTEFGRIERQIDAAMRGRAGEAGVKGGASKLTDRIGALRSKLPAVSSPTNAIDRTLGDVRELDDRLRRLRANLLLPPAMKRQQETALQLRMQQLLERALTRLDGEDAPPPTPAPAPADVWAIFAEDQ